MKKIILGMTLFLGVSITCIAEKEIQIGITQIVEHPSLDAARKGLEKVLQKNLGEKVEIEYQSAQGDFGTAQLIAKSYVNSKKDVIVAISTPSAQAALNATKQIPIVYTAVTDPKAAGLSGKNITGTTDMSPLEEQLNLLKYLLPKAKKIGFLYNPSEQNSISLLRQFTTLAKERQLQVIEKGVNTVNDMNLALNSLLRQVDVLYIPTDNLVTSSETLLIQQANRKSIPVIASVESSVKKGALATVSIDYEKLGYQTGERILEILKGKSPNQIKVEGLRQTTLVINERIAKKYGIFVKQEVLKEAVLYK
ncbi:MAG TPA: ABC transporter substrate-binding protein [Fusobacterium sp.]|uniref:ABC transporter substrate-binding protein n=1 Tax=Fusobacterium sp. TaxID=68766 RepID=UPI002F3F5068